MTKLILIKHSLPKIAPTHPANEWTLCMSMTAATSGFYRAPILKTPCGRFSRFAPQKRAQTGMTYQKFYEPQESYTHQTGKKNRYPGKFDTDGDGTRDDFNRAWLENFLQPVADFSAENGVPVAVDEFGVNRWVPGAAQFMDDEMGLFEQMGMNMAFWEWPSGWQPFVSDVNDMVYQFGPDENNITPVPNKLWEVVQKYWAHNTVRPSTFGQK